jgi:hypothetical protein
MITFRDCPEKVCYACKACSFAHSFLPLSLFCSVLSVLLGICLFFYQLLLLRLGVCASVLLYFVLFLFCSVLLLLHGLEVYCVASHPNVVIRRLFACPDGSGPRKQGAELKKEIELARADLRSKGMKF